MTMTQEEQKRQDDALIRAIKENNLAGMEKSIRAGAKIDAANVHGVQPVHRAATYGTESTLVFLLRNGAKIDAVDKYGEQPVHRAAELGRSEMLKSLFRHGSRGDATDGMGRQPLHWAARMGRGDVVEFLLENGADPMVKDLWHKTPLDLAENYLEVQGLLKKWSDPDFREKWRQEMAAGAIHAHWKRMARHVPKPGPSL